MQRTCETCGREFYVKPSVVQRGRGRFCSVGCYRRPNVIRVEDDVAYIELTDRFGNPKAEAVIDAVDIERVKAWRWHANWDERYQQYKVGAHVKIGDEWADRMLLHRFIVEAPDEMDVDHIDHNLLNNRRANLRVCTRAQNNQNLANTRRNSKSGIRGVHWDKKKRKWVAGVRIEGKRHYLGSFDNLKEAEAAAVEGRRRYMTHSRN